MISTIDDLTLIVYMDAGCFGETFLSKKKGSNQLYATKRISVKSIIQEPILKNYIQNEIMILKKVKHPNIVKLFDVKIKKDYIYLVMEYCNGGSLSSALENYKNKYGGPFSEEIVKFLMKQILLGVECLHKHGIIHRDLKLENILLKYNSEYEAKCENIFLSQIKIIDFDISSKAGTYIETYMDPTFVYNDLDDIVCDEKVDIWALGILCYEMLTGEKPFKEGEANYMIKKTDIKIPKNLSNEAQSFLLCMLQKDREKRFNASNLLRHNFIIKNSNTNGNININSNKNIDTYINKKANSINLLTNDVNNVNKLNTPINTNKNKSKFETHTFNINQKQMKGSSLPKTDINQTPEQNNQFRYSIQIKQAPNIFQNILVQRQENIQNNQPIFKEYAIGSRINRNQGNTIINYCKYIYIKLKGGKNIAKISAEAIKQKFGDNWLVLISNLNGGKFDFSISPSKKGDFIVFSLDDKLFQICRYY